MEMATPKLLYVAGIHPEPHELLGVQPQLLLLAPGDTASEVHKPVKIGRMAAQGQLAAAPGQPPVAIELSRH